MPRKKKHSRPKASRIRIIRRRGRPTALASASLAELKAEMDRRQRVVPALQANRARLENQLAILDRQLSLNGFAGTPRRRRSRRGRPASMAARRGQRRGTKRASNKFSLVDALHSALKGKTLSIKEVISAVKNAGYKSSSKNFRTMVSIAFGNNPKKFKRVKRGMYTAK